MSDFKQINDYFFQHESNLELVVKEEGKLKVIHSILMILDEYASKLKIGFDTHEESCNLWFANIIEYAKEAYNSARIGAIVSLAVMTRCVVENYVLACYINRYKSEKLWIKWYINSMVLNYNKFCKLRLSDEKLTEIQKDLERICDENGISLDWDIKSEYRWVSSVVKNKDIRISTLCNIIDKKIYSDYKHLSDFCHGINAINKTYRFTFIDAYFNILTTLVSYIGKAVEELVDDLEDEEYHEKSILFWSLMEE